MGRAAAGPGVRAGLRDLTSLRAVGFLALASLLIFADVLLPGTRVPAAFDVEVHGRLFEFAARHLARGELPLWNPHVFSGTPALGNPNAMMLYPFTLLSVVLPLPLAITLMVVLQTLLAAVFTYLWTRRRGLHPLGAVLAAAMVAFGGPFFARIEAGHLGVLAAMTWSPLVLLAVDELFRRVSAGWVAVGAVALAMQILGGHPQYVFYSLLAAVLSLVAQLPGASRRARVVGAFLLTIVWGGAITAIQSVSIVDALRASGRGSGLGFAAAAEFSLGWPGLLKLLAPLFYGRGAGTGYWGDWLFWETAPFVGIAGLTAAVYGAARGDRGRRRGAGMLALLFLVLALGTNTPLFGLLYESVPPFDRLRASARALFHFGLFTAMLAAVGLDALMRGRRTPRTLVAGLFATAVLLLAFAGWIRVATSGPLSPTRSDIEAVLRLPAEQRAVRIDEMAAGDPVRAERLQHAARARDAAVAAPEGPARDAATAAYGAAYVAAMSIDRWQDLRARLVQTKGYGYDLAAWADPAVARREAHAAVRQLLVAAGTCIVVALLLLRSSAWAGAGPALVVLGTVELLGFAWAMRTSVDFRGYLAPGLTEFFREHPGDYRIHDASHPNSAMSVGSLDIWGYDSFVSSRYAEYMAFTQGQQPPEGGSAFVQVARGHRSFPMLRLQYVLAEETDGVRVVVGPGQMAPPLPHAGLMHDYEVHPGGGAMLAALGSPAWDPASTVLLEAEPKPAPDPDGRGTVTIIDRSVDHLTVDAELDAPAILLVTDAWGDGWRVRPVDPADDQRYEVMPANHVLRAVPLPAGRHRIRMEYVPAYFGAGVMLTLLGLGLVLIVGARSMTRRASPPAADAAGSPPTGARRT